MKTRRAVFLFLLGGTLSHAKIQNIQVWARVANSVITDRAIQIESILENPKLWSPQELNIGIEDQSQSFQRLLIQSMVVEENRIFRSENVSNEEIVSDYRSLEKTLGLQFKSFKEFFDLNDQNLKEKIAARILLEKALKSRVKSYAQNLSPKDQQRVIEDWISQLKGRYRVQNYRLDKNNPRLKLITGDSNQ